MKRKLWIMFMTVEVNLILWLAVCGNAWTNNQRVDTALLWVGLAFSIVVQHWAYYSIYKAAKQEDALRARDVS